MTVEILHGCGLSSILDTTNSQPVQPNVDSRSAKFWKNAHVRKRLVRSYVNERRHLWKRMMNYQVHLPIKPITQ